MKFFLMKRLNYNQHKWTSGGERVRLDYKGMKEFIEQKGYKQSAIAEKVGISSMKLSQILNGNRKCEAGEYANICKELNVPYEKFIKEG